MAEQRRQRKRPAAMGRTADNRIPDLMSHFQELDAQVGEALDELANRITIIEEALVSAWRSIEEIEAAVFEPEEGYDEPEEGYDGAGESVALPQGWEGGAAALTTESFGLPSDGEDEGEPITSPDDARVFDSTPEEREQRQSTAAIRRAERAAYGVDEDGPRAGIMTGAPGEDAAIPDFKVTGGGNQVQAPVDAQGEEGWSGNSAA